MVNVTKIQQRDQRADNIHNGPSMQRENPGPGGVLKLAPEEKCILVHR